MTDINRVGTFCLNAQITRRHFSVRLRFITRSVWPIGVKMKYI